MTKALIVPVILLFCCAPAERPERETAGAREVVETRASPGREECEPGTDASSVIPEQDPRDFRYRMSSNALEKATRPAHPTGEIEAEYSSAARANRVQGIVIVEVGVRADGSLAGARVLKGLPCGLEGSALEAVHKADWVPGTLDGEPIDSVTTVSVRFTLPAP